MTNETMKRAKSEMNPMDLSRMAQDIRNAKPSADRPISATVALGDPNVYSAIIEALRKGVTYAGLISILGPYGLKLREATLRAYVRDATQKKSRKKSKDPQKPKLKVDGGLPDITDTGKDDAEPHVPRGTKHSDNDTKPCPDIVFHDLDPIASESPTDISQNSEGENYSRTDELDRLLEDLE